jgi:hypothetical protein
MRRREFIVVAVGTVASPRVPGRARRDEALAAKQALAISLRSEADDLAGA